MRVLILLVLAVWLAACPVRAAEPFIAVFCSPDIAEGPIKPWNNYKHKLDLFHVAKSWKEFKPFLKEVKRKAQGRPIIIDLSVHGVPEGVFIIVKGDTLKLANQGAICNDIQEVGLNTERLVLVEESCYAGYVFVIGMFSECPTEYIERYKGAALNYPVYGVENYVNYIRLSLEQYLHKKHLFIKDLRPLTLVNIEAPIAPPSHKEGDPLAPIYYKEQLLLHHYRIMDHLKN